MMLQKKGALELWEGANSELASCEPGPRKAVIRKIADGVYGKLPLKNVGATENEGLSLVLDEIYAKLDSSAADD